MHGCALSRRPGFRFPDRAALKIFEHAHGEAYFVRAVAVHDRPGAAAAELQQEARERARDEDRGPSRARWLGAPFLSCPGARGGAALTSFLSLPSANPSALFRGVRARLLPIPSRHFLSASVKKGAALPQRPFAIRIPNGKDGYLIPS